MNRPTGWNVCIPREMVGERSWVLEQEIALLEPDHWLDWSHTPIIEYPNELSGFTPMLWNDAYVGSTTTWLRMKRQPGETWLLFNEPDLNFRAEYSLFDRNTGQVSLAAQRVRHLPEGVVETTRLTRRRSNSLGLTTCGRCHQLVVRLPVAGELCGGSGV